MEINVNPKQQFLTLEQIAAEFRVLVLKDSFQTAITYATAEMNFKGKFSSEQMQAVRSFIDTLCNLGEKVSPMRKYPSKNLTYENPGRPSKPKTETI